MWTLRTLGIGKRQGGDHDRAISPGFRNDSRCPGRGGRLNAGRLHDKRRVAIICHTGSAVAMAVLNAIQNPVIMVDDAGPLPAGRRKPSSGASASHLARYKISTFIPFGSPLLA